MSHGIEQYAAALALVLDAGFALAQPKPGGGPPLDVVTVFGAKPDAVWGLTGCSVGTHTTNTTMVCSQTLINGFSLGPMQTATIIADDLGATADGKRAPYVGTLSAVSRTGSSTTFTFSPAANFDTGPNGTITHLTALNVAAPGSGYSFGSSQSVTCAGSSGCLANDILATGTPALMTPVSVALSSAGTLGSANATCTLVSATQIGLAGTLTSVVATLNGMGEVSTFTVATSGTISSDTGSYTATTGIYKEAFNGCGFQGSNRPTFSLSYGVVLEQLDPSTGVYAETPPCSGSGSVPASVTGGGTGLTLTCPGTFTNTVSIGTDNTCAFRTALKTMNFDAGLAQPVCTYVPAGNYLMSPLNASGNTCGSSSATLSRGYGCWLGDEHLHSNIFVIPQLSGDVFAWANANTSFANVNLGSTLLFSNSQPMLGPNAAGSSFRNITIIGDRLAPVTQNGLVFYGITERAYIDNAAALYLNGSGFVGGMTMGTGITMASFKESVIQNLRLEHDGNRAGGIDTPAFEVTAAATEGSNGLFLSNIRLYQNYGTGMRLHAGSATANTRDIFINNLLIEGSNIDGLTAGGDLLEIDNAQDPGPASVGSVMGRNVELVNPVPGFAALHLAKNSGAAVPSQIDIEGVIMDATMHGRGVAIDGCGQCSIKMLGNVTGDFGLLVGTPQAGGGCSSSTLPGPGLAFNGVGNEANLFTCIDQAATGRVQFARPSQLGNGNLANLNPGNPIDQAVSTISTLVTGTTLS